jgi:hypothetical protein
MDFALLERSDVKMGIDVDRSYRTRWVVWQETASVGIRLVVASTDDKGHPSRGYDFGHGLSEQSVSFFEGVRLDIPCISNFKGAQVDAKLRVEEWAHFLQMLSCLRWPPSCARTSTVARNTLICREA